MDPITLATCSRPCHQNYHITSCASASTGYNRHQRIRYYLLDVPNSEHFMNDPSEFRHFLAFYGIRSYKWNMRAAVAETPSDLQRDIAMQNQGIRDARSLGTPKMLCSGSAAMFAMFGATVLEAAADGACPSPDAAVRRLGTLFFHFLRR